MIFNCPKFLLFGKNGQLGFELQRSISILGEIFAVGRAECNLSDKTAIRQLIQKIKPDIIINAAAYTDVDQAESDIKSACEINIHAPQVMAEEANKINALLIHYSTDYVFDGKKTTAYCEYDKTNPESVYGKSKLFGEQMIRDNCARHIIFRTSWVFSVHGKNFLKSILNQAQNEHELNVVIDQVGAPTSASLLADISASIVAKYLCINSKCDFSYGTYHLTSTGKISRYAFAKFIIEQAALCGFKCLITKDMIYPIRSRDYFQFAKRPLNSCLDTTKLQLAFGLHLPNWQQDVVRTLHLLKCRL